MSASTVSSVLPDPLGLVLAVAAGLSLLMAGAWLVQRATGNAGWVDAIWSAGTGAASVAFALASLPQGQQGRILLLSALALFWSGRLALTIARRVARSPEDARYHAFRARWGDRYQWRMFCFFQAQGACALLLALAVLLAARNPAPFPTLFDVAGTLILIIAVLGEALADDQLRRWKRDGGRGVCAVGLWRWSRHPNYFFEWLGWWAYPLIATDPSGLYHWGWLAVVAPAFIYWLLTRVSGVPPLEEHMLQSKGEAYRDYQRRTNMFFPGPQRAALSRED